MPVPISDFLTGGEMLVGDIVAGLRTVAGVENDYQFDFPGTGIKDHNGAYLLRWLPGAGVNTNYAEFTSAATGLAPSLIGTGNDTNVNLNLGAKGVGYVDFIGTGAVKIPAGTAVQAPTPFVAGGIRFNLTSGYFDYWSPSLVAWVDLTSGSALSNLTFVTNTDETAFAPNSQPLSLLATGFATVTTTTGIVGSRVLTGTTNEISISHGDGTTGNPTFSVPTTFIAPGTIAAVTSVSAPEYLLTGSGSGTISILPQAAAGTYNFNMPITAGTSGYVLTSAGGGSSPMTWTNLSSATVTSISGTANEITASASTGAVTLSIPSTFIAPGSIQATTSSAAASFLLNGSGSGVISILPQAAAGTYNFNMPITAGTSGYVLTSAGGGSSPMTWTNLGSATVTSISGTANEITASASTGAVTLSIPSTFIAPGSIQATTSSAAASFLLNGSGSGVISILPQAAAGTYNFNLPITAGTSGYILTSGGGAGAAMTWTNPASIGGVTSVSGTSNRITASPTTGAVVVDIAATYVGQTSITTLGTIGTGTWQATAVTVPYGGTGNTTFTAYSLICAGTTATGTFQNVSGLGSAGQALLSNGAGALPSWQTIAAGNNLSQSIHQVAHGFSVQNVVYLNSTTYTLAKADAVATAEVVGLVTAVADADHFTITFGGYITGFSGLTGGVVYFLSDATAGLLSATQPSTVGNVSKPLFVADSTTSGYFFNYRGKIIPAAATNGTVTSVGISSSDLTVGSSPITTSGTITLSLNTVPVTKGGTNNTTFTAYSVLCAGTTATGAFQNVSGLGTSGYVLTSNGAGALPTWQAASGGSAISTIDGNSGSMSGTTVTINGGTTGLTTSASSATMSLTGTLVVANGGTGVATLTTAYGLLTAGTTATGNVQTVATGSSGQILQSAGNAAVPAWSTSTYPATNAVSTLLYASSANVMAALATANSAMLVTNSSGVPAWSGTMTNGQLIIGNTSGTPTAQTLTAGAGITITNGANSITVAASPGTGAQAWVTYNGVTPAVAKSSNVTSVTHNGTGDYTINITSALSDANYAVGLGGGELNADAVIGVSIKCASSGGAASTKTTSALQLATGRTSTATLVDNSETYAIMFD